jgi:ergothioneine biosynthesis protein EgtC
MCRFVLYLGEPVVLETLLFKPVNSLVNQSYDAEERDPLNGDGFGVAWYAPHIVPEPAVFKSATPAWNNRNLTQLGRVTRSECVLAHVRAATPGLSVNENNCHPFVSKNLAFMHNGGIGDFQAIRRSLLTSLSDESFHGIQGETDSEHLFALFLDCWRARQEPDPLIAMAAALEEAIDRTIGFLRDKKSTADCQFNIAVSDGKRAVASRFATGDTEKMPTLYWHQGRRYVCQDGICHMVDFDANNDTVIIASEPLSDDPGWETVEPNSMILVGEDHQIAFRPVRVPHAQPCLRVRVAS